MEYREIVANSIDEAKIKIKKEYGNKARIIKVVESRQGGFLGIGKKKLVKVLISISDVDLLKKFKENMGIPHLNQDTMSGKADSDREASPDVKEYDRLMEKLENIERRMGGENHEGKEHLNINEVKQILKENEFYDEFIDGLVNKMKNKLSYSDIDNRIEVHKFVYQYIRNKLSFYEGPKDTGAANKRVLVLVGPTGVGKTTTIAKIAAHAIREKLKVELITIDGYRIGAKYQLQKYAEYMRTPMSGVEDNLELQKLVDLSDAQLILIDTIGRSARDEMNLVKMKQLLKLERYRPEYVLTISASTKVSEVKKIFKSFAVFDYQSLIITKVDESDTIGGILNTAINEDCSIRYFTNGQRVPNDIERANADNLMSRISGLEIGVYLDSIT